MQGLAHAAWPKSSAVDAIATEAKRLVNSGVENPYVYVDLKSPPKDEVHVLSVGCMECGV